LLQVEDLRVAFDTFQGRLTAVDGISFRVKPGEVLGLVGESGSGKSVTSLSLLRLLPQPPGKVEARALLFDGRELQGLGEKEMRRIRGGEMAMIFQAPAGALNPVYTIGCQVEEVLRLHRGLSKKEARTRAVEMLRLVGLPRPERVAREYPHRLSGGMLQRAMIAMALSGKPKLIIADEPTTALDVTIQAQVLELMKEMQRRFNTAFILISHDLGVVAEMADRVAVMYAGRIVEEAETAALLKRPLHPYTGGLIASRPALAGERKPLQPIPGQGPDLLNRPPGCLYHPRCHRRREICRQESPPELQPEPGRRVSCWLYAEEQEDGGGDR
jgi:oligopeptide/dipeptide ABC transporter ATP-binding protein